MPLTEAQRKAAPVLRAMVASDKPDFTRALPFERRAHLPPPNNFPSDITAHVDIAPPLSAPLPLVDAKAQKQPERVPIFYYELRSENVSDAPEKTKVIFYIHGGGNVQSHPTDDIYINFIAALLRAASTAAPATCIVIAPCYRLATVPENAFPGALQDILAAYDYVISQGYVSSNITVAGDSAGGNHALLLTHLALHSNRPLPQGVVVISPQSLQVYDDLSDHAKAQTNTDLLTLNMYKKASECYVNGTGFAPTDPLVSGALLPFTDAWPKTLILLGTGDTLTDASWLLERRLRESKRPVELVEYDELPHAWWLVSTVFAEEIADAAERVARLVHGKGSHLQ